MVKRIHMKRLLILFSCLVFAAETAIAQSKDSVERRNTIKLDITSHWLYRNAVVFAYERTVKNRPNQTWGITAGYQVFPGLSGSDFDTINVKREFNSSGYKLGGEYRFYLQKENKFNAPHGIYVGPYTTLHNYTNSRNIEVLNNGSFESATLKTRFNIYNIGVQLGYQFVIKNRWTIDLVFIGPSISYYSANVNLGGNFTFDPDDISNEILLALIDKFPSFEELIDEGEIKSAGKLDVWSLGYRYQFQVGYHFGRKK
jgi:hypothetical protein